MQSASRPACETALATQSSSPGNLWLRSARFAGTTERPSERCLGPVPRQGSCVPSVLSGKPVALLGVAAGAIGAIKALEHLRSVCSHIGTIVLPGPVSIAAVHTVFDDDGNCTDEKVEKRIRGVATNLTDYIKENICPRIALEEMVRKE